MEKATKPGEVHLLLKQVESWVFSYRVKLDSIGYWLSTNWGMAVVHFSRILNSRIYVSWLSYMILPLAQVQAEVIKKKKKVIGDAAEGQSTELSNWVSAEQQSTKISKCDG